MRVLESFQLHLETRMNSLKNARLTPKFRVHFMKQIALLGLDEAASREDQRSSRSHRVAALPGRRRCRFGGSLLPSSCQPPRHARRQAPAHRQPAQKPSPDLCHDRPAGWSLNRHRGAYLRPGWGGQAAAASGCAGQTALRTQDAGRDPASGHQEAGTP